jgi:hypothetical protein
MSLPKFTFRLPHLVNTYGWRGKNWRWTEILRYTGQTPSQLSLSSGQHVDPSYWLTLNGKNRYKELYLPAYTSPHRWRVHTSNYGASWQLNQGNLWDKVNRNFQLDQWFALMHICYTLYTFPGVKTIYSLGSLPLEISNPRSDLDIAVECYPGFPILTRFWIKLYLKFRKIDSHPLFTPLIEHDPTRLRSKLYQYKQIKQRVDVGLLYQRQEQINTYFHSDERHLFIHSRIPIVRSFAETLQCESSLFLYPRRIWLDRCIQILFTVVSIPLVPVACLQYILQKRNHNPNHTFTRSFINFYPLHLHEPEALTDISFIDKAN